MFFCQNRHACNVRELVVRAVASRRAGYRRTPPITAVFAACMLAALAWFITPFVVRSDERARSFVPVEAPTKPVELRGATPKLLSLSPQQCVWVRNRVQPPDDGRLTPSMCLHLMLLHGTEMEVKTPRSNLCASLLDTILNDQLGAEFFGAPALLKTRYGLRFRPNSPVDGSSEAHRDQCLAALGELEVPLGHPVLLGNEELAVRDILNDSLATFHLAQDDIAWTAQAYAAYLPPACSWRNSFNEPFSFDDLTVELLDRPVNETSCFGMHLLISQAAIARADEQIKILSPVVRSRLIRRISDVVAACVASQGPDGSWGPEWYGDTVRHSPMPASDPPFEGARLLMTAHVADWIQALPAELKVPGAVRRRAGESLIACLRSASQKELSELFCPYSHAACTVLRWAGVPFNRPARGATEAGAVNSRTSPTSPKS